MAADQIVVLDGSRMAGVGRHAVLVNTCPAYAEFVDSQSMTAGGRGQPVTAPPMGGGMRAALADPSGPVSRLRRFGTSVAARS